MRLRTSGKCSRIFDTGTYTGPELEEIEALLQFDSAFYLAEYPDVAEAGFEPLQHFLLAGLDETRLPSAREALDAPLGLDKTLGFDPKFYLARYTDVQDDPFLHFLTHGIREHRLPFDLGENLAAERLTTRILKKAGVILTEPLEVQARLDAETWATIPGQLEKFLPLEAIEPKLYRNNYWLAMGAGLLAQVRLGAAACCYNFFFNYYVPMAWLGNGQQEMIGTARVSTVPDALALDGAPCVILDTAASVDVPEPVFLNRVAAEHGSVRIDLPKPVSGVLRDIEVIGGTSLIVQRGHSVLYDYLETGERARELQCPSLVHVIGGHCSYRLPTRTIEVEEAFSLLHDHGHNYYHWLLEVLPRYLLARREGLTDDVPVLVEDHMAPQMQEILRLIFAGEPPLLRVPRSTAARVRRLHWMADICINSVHTDCPPNREDILISPTAVGLLRDLASPYFTHLPDRYENVLIVRKDVDFRRLVNRGVFQLAMNAAGLSNFNPGGASWIEQVRVFSNARLIVAEAGAALANLVFCRPGTNVIILVNGHPNSNYYYLSQLSGLVGINVFFFECYRLAGSHALGVQDDMIVPVTAFSQLIRRFLTEPPPTAPSEVPANKPRLRRVRA